MFNSNTWKERTLTFQAQCLRDRLSTLDIATFRLDPQVDNLTRSWQGKTPDEQREMRKRRMEARSDLELMKLELAKIERDRVEFERELAKLE